MGEHVFTCLICQSRPILANKVAAYAHARSEHRSLLDDGVLPEEMFEVHGGVSIPVNAEADQPHICLFLGCGAHRHTASAAKNHLSQSHRVYDPVLGVDFAPEEEGLRILTIRKRDARQYGDRAARVLESVLGVRDFLTECGEWPA